MSYTLLHFITLRLVKDTELRKERDRELFSIYLVGLRERHFDSMQDAVDWVRSQPASKFYISSKALVNYIGAMKHGSTPPKMFPWNEKKIKMLYDRYLEFKASNPDCRLSRERIGEIRVDEPAPMFFSGHESWMKIITRERKRHKREMSER